MSKADDRLSMAIATIAAIALLLMSIACSSRPQMSYFPTADMQRITDLELGSIRTTLEIDRVNEVLRLIPVRDGSVITIPFAIIDTVDYKRSYNADDSSHVPVFENKEHWLSIKTAWGDYTLEVKRNPERVLAMLAASGFPISMTAY